MWNGLWWILVSLECFSVALPMRFGGPISALGFILGFVLYANVPVFPVKEDI